MKQRSVFLSDGTDSLELAPILSIEGLSFGEQEYSSSAGYLQDGVLFGPGRYLPRTVTLQFDVLAGRVDEEGAFTSPEEACRSFLSRLARLIGKREGGSPVGRSAQELQLEIRERDTLTGSVSRYYLSPCRVLGCPGDPQRQGKAIRTVTLQLTAGDPYIKKEVRPQVLSQEDERKIYQNDYLWYADDQLVLSQNRLEVTVLNGGDADTPMEIRFYGPAVQPYVLNQNTGEKIGVNQTLASGEYMDINTAYGKKSITITTWDQETGQTVTHNAFHYIQQGCVFPMLHPGENRLKYGSGQEGGSLSAGVEIRYDERYLSLPY